jgi:hypothetical protein
MKTLNDSFQRSAIQGLSLLLLAAALILAPQVRAGDLDENIPMAQSSWIGVQGFVNDLNNSYVPSPKVSFKYAQPQKVLSEKTAVLTLESVRDSLETNSGIEPWVFQHINMMCDHPACTGQ